MEATIAPTLLESLEPSEAVMPLVVVIVVEVTTAVVSVAEALIV